VKAFELDCTRRTIRCNVAEQRAPDVEQVRLCDDGAPVRCRAPRVRSRGADRQRGHRSASSIDAPVKRVRRVE
jgi:hypothetical protein